MEVVNDYDFTLAQFSHKSVSVSVSVHNSASPDQTQTWVIVAVPVPVAAAAFSPLFVQCPLSFSFSVSSSSEGPEKDSGWLSSNPVPSERIRRRFRPLVGRWVHFSGSQFAKFDDR
jgi:hypothetical protein